MTLQVLLIDNFDSFTFNLAEDLRARDARVEVWRNDAEAEAILERILALAPPRLLVLSPGPGRPEEAGCIEALVRVARGRVPLFGVCLGMQAIVQALGGEVGPAGEIVHGKASAVEHDGSALFSELPSPFFAGRYHSLAAVRVPEDVRVTAHSGGLVMAVEHRHDPIAGVQFHPESILTPRGGRLLDAVTRWAGRWREAEQERVSIQTSREEEEDHA